MNRGAWWATVHGISKSWTWLNKFTSLLQVLQVMVLSPLNMLYRNLGIHTVENETSKKARFLKKKYISVLRWESMNVRMIMVRFPVTLITYVRNKKTKIRTSNCGSSVNPNKMNVVMTVWFLITSFDVLYDLYVTKSKTSYLNRWKEIISKKRKNQRNGKEKQERRWI